MDLNMLDEPFAPSDIEWRAQSCGEKNGNLWVSVLAYVTNRAIMKRLDDVCGKANWKNEFRDSGKAVECGISIKIDGEWVTKWDAAEETNIEGVKGGRSGAMKRAAVQWGIGRYLYDLESTWGNVNSNGKKSQKTKDGKWFKWDAPNLPQWALPRTNQQEPQNQQCDNPDGILKSATAAMSNCDMNTLKALFAQYKKDLHGYREHLDKLNDVKDIRKAELEVGDM